MNNKELNAYFEAQVNLFNSLIELLEEMENKNLNFTFYEGVAYNKKNLMGKINRIRSRVQGVKRYIEKTNSNEWQEIHEILINKLSENEYWYHISFDSSHNLSCATSLINSVLETGGEIDGDVKKMLKNAINKVVQTSKYMQESKDEWVKNRFFELASRIEFNKNKSLYPNVKELENVHPLDIISNGHVDLDVLKKTGNHHNIFEEKLNKIKKEAYKESLFNEAKEKNKELKAIDN